jgi:hypothetical protein
MHLAIEITAGRRSLFESDATVIRQSAAVFGSGYLNTVSSCSDMQTPRLFRTDF